MSKAKMNYLVDILILISFLLTAVSGIILLLVPGASGLSRTVVLGISRAGWVELHDWAGIGMTIGVVLHFFLHWKWIVYMTKNIFSGGRSAQTQRACPVTIETEQ